MLDRVSARMATYIPPGAPAARTVADKLAEFVSVKDFGAVGDGIADDTDAIQAALDRAAQTGGEVRFPAGVYRITKQVTVWSSDTTDRARVSISGSGAGCTVIKGEVGYDTPIVYFDGSEGMSPAGLSAFQFIRDIRIEGNGAAGIGIAGKNLAYFAVQNVTILWCADGMRFMDILSSRFDNVIVRSGLRGFTAGRAETPEVDFESDPNNITFTGCTFSSLSQYGLFLNGGACVNFVGGSIENIGYAEQWPPELGPRPALRWGAKFDNMGREGAAGCTFLGTYFEWIDGAADVWIDQSNDAPHGASYSFVGCDFLRCSAEKHSLSNIRFDTDLAPGTLSVTGCGFRGVGSYVASAERPCIRLPTTASGWKASQHGNFFGQRDDAPCWSETPTLTVFLESDVVIANDATVTLPFRKRKSDGTYFGEDYSNCWDDSVHGFRAPYTLRMNFTATIGFYGMTTEYFVDFRMLVNGTVVAKHTGTTGTACFMIDRDINLHKDDVVQFQVFANAGGNPKTIYAGPDLTCVMGRAV